MKFLEEIVDVVLNHHVEETDKLTIVFPNRRAGLFFQKYLSGKITEPIWSPKITNIEDFVLSLSNLKTADKLELIFDLYQVFRRLNNSTESFDRFYYWGNILLQDFDELDKFLIDPELLFKNLAHVKEMENSLDYLDDNQKKLIGDFWKSFGDKLSSHQKGFLEIWENLFQTYLQFKNRLYEKGIAYNGMIYRDVEEELQIGQSHPETGIVIFAGFNALSKSEESIISWFVKEGKGEVYWDADDHYFKDYQQEAGRYLREMKSGNPVLRNTFKKSYGNSFLESDKNIEVLNVASDVGQAQQASEILGSKEINLDENTALVLPNNELLFPVLHALPERLEKLNITMGFPLNAASIYGFLDSLISLQWRSEQKSVYHFRTVLAILRHPVMAAYRDETISGLESYILENNAVWISKHKFETEHELLSLIFSEAEDFVSDYLLEILRYLGEKSNDELEGEFIYHFYTLLNRLQAFIATNKLMISKEAFQKLFRQLSQGERLPFEGEPLLGLQVMGILETRNLDFDNLIILSANETLIPPAPKNTSLIPHSIRKVFELPVVDHQDAIYAYIFYRLIQRAKNVFFIYNATEETGKSGEVSRFIRQLEYETNFKIKYKTVSSEVTIEDPPVLTVVKNRQILKRLFKYTSKENFQKRFTPTALNTYLDCGLKFYFRYVLELYEKDEMTEDVDPMVFGNILHHVMERLYQPFDTDGNRTVQITDIPSLKAKLDKLIEIEFSEQFGREEHEFEFEGQNILVREVIKKMALKVLEFDKKRTPFEILGVEADTKKGYLLNFNVDVDGEALKVGMKGIIDRIDKKDEEVRIVDYKTGTDKKSFSDIPALFDRENKMRNKAVFQTFFYGLLYLNSPGCITELPVQASLFNIRELFNSDFSPLIQYKNSDVTDIRVYLDEFNRELNALVQEIFDSKIDFVQTEDLKKCGYCPYVGICNR